MTKAKISTSFGAILAASVIFSPNFASAADTYDARNDALADPAPAAQADWTGLHFGVFGGWAWADWDGPYSYDDDDQNALIFDGASKSIKDNNWFAGAGIGGDQQFGNVVAGVIVDAAIADLSQTDTFKPYPDQGNPVSWDMETEIEYFGTARGRIGYLLKDNFLAYATGGLAWARVESSISPVYHAGEPGEYTNGSASAKNNHLGWAAGAGFEWRLSDQVSFTTEYLYLDLGKQDYRFDGTTNGGSTYATDNYHPDLDMHAIKAGLNYRF